MTRTLMACVVLLALSTAACTDPHTQYQRRIAEYASRLQTNPQDPDAHYQLGVAYLSAGNWKAGSHHLKDTVRLNKSHTQALRDLGWAMYQLGDLAAAEKWLRQSHQLHGKDPKTAANLGAVLIARERYSAAVVVLEGALRNGLSRFEVHNNLAIAYRHLGEKTKAAHQLRVASRLAPDVARVHSNLGALYETLNMDDDAFQQYSMALNLDPGEAAAHYNLGAYHARHGNKLLALGHLHEAQRLRPTDPTLLIGLGRAFADLKQYDKALEHYEASLRYRPGDADTFLEMAELYHLNQQPEKAVDAYNLAISLDPDRPQAYYKLALLYDQLEVGENALLYMAVAEREFLRQNKLEEAETSRHNLGVFARKYQYGDRELKRLLKRHDLNVAPLNAQG